MPQSTTTRRSLIFILVATLLVLIIFVNSLQPSTSNAQDRLSQASPFGKSRITHDGISTLDKQPTMTGGAIAPKLGNETVKAELGRAAWKLFHTTFARFPDKPTADESSALRSYIQLFARLYPCGECAGHFMKILEEYPPQVGSRSAAAGWGCHVHNEVSKSLKKDLFDCSKIGDFYDCGCADDEEEEGSEEKLDTSKESSSKATKHYTESGRTRPIELEREG